MSQQECDDAGYDDVDYVDLVRVAVERCPDAMGLVSVEPEGIDQGVHETVKTEVEGEGDDGTGNDSRKKVTGIED